MNKTLKFFHTNIETPEFVSQKTSSGLSYTHNQQKSAPPARPILFVHGMCGGKWQFRNWLLQCAEIGIEAFALDLRGHEESSGANHVGELSIYDYVANVQEIIREIIRQPIRLVGHSMGAVVAQKFTAEHPGWVSALGSLMSANPWGIVPRGPIVWRAVHPYYLRAIFGNHPFTFREKDEDLFFNRCPSYKGKKVFGPESGKAAREVLFWQIPLRGNGICCPHTVVSGRYDRVTLPTQQKDTHRKFKGSKLLELDCGHMLMFEAQAATYLQKILAEL